MEQPSQWIYSFGNGQAEGSSDVKHLIGGKGASLAEMTRAGLNVPPGFTISTQACQLFYKHQETWPDGLLDQIRAALTRLENATGRELGKGAQPLLVAVRSGAAQSMPGMMDTILNVGLNPECVRALAEHPGDPRGAWRDYFDFQLMYAKTVLASHKKVDDRDIQTLVNRHLDTAGAVRIENLDAGQMEQLCQSLRELLQSDYGIDFPTDPWDMLTGAVLAVFRSWNSERALTYRKHHKMDGLMGTAVNVQAMCPSQISGVMFTTNPVQAGIDEIIIESSYGLGEAIVLGKVTPDRFVLDKNSLEVLVRQAAPRQAEKHQHNGDALSLDDGRIRQLAELGLKVEGYFQTPCDIEWGWVDGQFFLLQSRPIRHKGPRIDPAERENVRREEIAALKALADPRGTVWARFNLSEILPEPTPMTWAVVREFMSGKGGFGQMYRDIGFDPDPALDEIGIFDLVCGRPYCNLSREPRMQYRSMPFEHSFAALKANPSQALYPQASLALRRAGLNFWLSLPFTFVKMAWASRRLKRLEKSYARQFVEEIVPKYLAEVKTAEKEDLSRVDLSGLLERFRNWMRKALYDFARESLKPTAFAGIAMANLEQTLAQRLTPFAHEPERMKENAAKGSQRAQAFVRELVMGVHPEAASDLPGALRDLAAGKLSKERFLDDFGHRGSMEMELAKPRWREESAALVAGTGEATNAHTSHIAKEDPSDTVWDRLAMEASLMPFQREILWEDVRTLHEYLRLRETAKHQLMRGYALLRRYLAEMDRRLELNGGIFFLTPGELPEVIARKPGANASAPGADASGSPLGELMRQRRRRREVALSLPAPQVLFSDNLEAIGVLEEIHGAAIMQGVPLSAGVAEGEAWVLHEAVDAMPPSDDYILVCPSTDPAWVPLFVKARGLVMETGGVLSHGAIVAREFGLPAVAGISDVHRRLKTGQRLRVDGGTGRVSVLD